MDGQLIGGRYVAAAQLGSGVSADVWAAVDDAGRWRCLRVLSPGHSSAAVRARSESLWSVLASVRHPHLVRAHEVVDHDGRCVLVSDLVECADLRLRAAAGAPEIDRAARWGAQVAGALAALHEAGVVHGDVRPANVLLDACSGDVVLADAGVRQIVTGESPTVGQDLYRLGAVLYEVICGRVPFETVSTRRRLLAVPSRPAGMPDGLWRVVVSLLTGDRAMTAARAEADLRTLLPSVAGLPAVTFTGECERAATPSDRWRRRVVAAGAAAVTGALLGGGVAAAALFSDNAGADTSAPTHPHTTLVEVVPGAEGAEISGAVSR